MSTQIQTASLQLGRKEKIARINDKRTIRVLRITLRVRRINRNDNIKFVSQLIDVKLTYEKKNSLKTLSN